MRLNWHASFKDRISCWLWTNRYQLAVLGMSYISVSSVRNVEVAYFYLILVLQLLGMSSNRFSAFCYLV